MIDMALASLEGQDQNRQRWFKNADEAYKLIGQTRTIAGLYLAEPFAPTEAAAQAVEDLKISLANAEHDLRAAYRAVAIAGTGQGQ